MLDSDLANLYECTNGTKTINQSVSRNKERFPKDFYFQLTSEEFAYLKSLRFQSGILLISNKNSLRSQIGTSKEKRGGRQYLPYVFTEQGVAMLSSVLRTEKAAKVSVNIMRTFIQMRKFIDNNYRIFERLNNHELKFLEHDNKFDEIFERIKKDEEFKQKIFFEGQIYDAYSLLVDLIKKAKEKIVIIDNYIDKTLLDLLSNKNNNVVVLILTQSKKLSEMDIAKFNEQYFGLTIKYSNNFHDRFIIIDDEIYHSGASLKDLGKKTFAINKMEDKNFINSVYTGV